MANNRQIVSIGVQLDYKRELEGMLDDLRAQMKKLGDSAKDIELSANLQKQISTLESRLAVVSDDIADMFRKMGDQDIDIKAFSKFQDEIMGMTRKIQTEMLDLKRMLEGLSEGTDASKMFSHFSEMESKFAELRTEIQTTTRLITDFYEAVEGTSSKATINFQSDFDEKKLQRAKELLKQLEDLNKKEREVYNYDRESKYTDSTPMEDFEKSFDAIIKRWNELNKLQKELKTRANNGEGVDFYKEQIAAIRAEKDLLYQEMDDMVDALSERKNVSDAVARRVEQFTNNPYKPFEGEDTKNVINSLKGQIGEMKKLQKEAETAAEAASQNLEISMFSIKNGKINVPIEIDVIQKQRDKTLEQSILNTIEKLQEVIKSHPVLLDVKLKTNNNPYDKEGVKKKLLTQKDVKEYFNSDIDDIQTLDDKDLGKNFFNSFIESSKEAYNVAKVVIDKINETLNVTKIKITKDNISIDEDTIKGLFEQFSKMFDEAQIDQFVEYFAESFSSLLGANDFEEALLQSLNNATDRWVQHFNESMNGVSALLANAFGEGTGPIGKPDNTKLINDEIAKRIENAKRYKERYDADKDIGSSYIRMENELARLAILKKYAADSNIDVSKYSKQLEAVKDLAYYNDLIQKGWQKYFNNTADHSVSEKAYLKSILPQEMKEVDAKINLDAETIAVWRQTFLDAIAEVSVSLKSSLSSSAASSVDSWRNGMMDAVNEVAGQFASTMNGTVDLSSMIAGKELVGSGMNELYYNLAGWRESSRIMRESRDITDDFSIINSLKKAELTPELLKNRLGITDESTIKRIETLFDYLTKSYAVNREYIGELERNGLYDIGTGKFIDGFVVGHSGVIPGKLAQQTYEKIKNPSDAVDFHWHPVDKRFNRVIDNNVSKSKASVIGSDLFFSGGDLDAYAQLHRMRGIKKYAVASGEKLRYLDFSDLDSSLVNEIARRYNNESEVTRTFLDKFLHFGEHKGVNYGSNGVFDFDEWSTAGEKILAKIITDVTGQDASKFMHTLGIEEIANNPKKMKDIGLMRDAAQISSTTELLENMADTIQKISDGGGFKIDTSSIDSLANSLQEILVILQRIHEEANIAFSIPGLNILSGSELQEKATDIIGENIDNLKSQIGVKDALLPVFKDYYDGIGKLKSGKDIWKDVFKEGSDFAFDDLSHIFQDKESYRQAIISWYNEYTEKQKQIANINEELFNIGSPTKSTDGLKLDISSEDLENIASHLREILDLMKQLYDASSVGKLQAQWSEIENKFKSFAKDDGSVDARKKEYSELIGMIQQYQKMGGEDFSSLTDNTKTIEKINASLEKARAKEVTEETHSTEGTVNDVAQAFEKIETAAKEFSDIIEPVIKNVDRLIEVLSKTPENGGIGEYLENLGGKLDVFGGLDAKKIKAVSSALKSLEGIKLDNLQSVPAFSAFIDDLNRLQVQAEVIKDIAEIMKQTKGKPIPNNITGTNGYKNANAIPDALYNAEYENWAKKRKESLQKELNQNGEVRYNQVGETSISHLSSGLVNMTNIVQTADGGWKQLTVTMDNSFKTIEKASKVISESQGMRALGLVSEKEEKVLQANLKEALKLAKEYQIASAKSGSWDVLSPTATEKLTIDNVKRLDNEIKATLKNYSKDQFSGQTQALLKQYDDQITFGGGEFIDRVQTAKNLLEELDAEVKTVVDDLKQMSGPEAARAVDKISADYSAYVSDYISGAATQETLDKKTGGLLSRYKNIVGFYRGIDSQDARTAYLKDYIKSTYGDFEYDWSKGSKTGMGKDVDTVIAKYKDLNNEVRTVTATIDTSTNAIRVQQTASAQYVNGLDKFFTSLKAKVLEGARYLMAYVSIQDIWRYFREGVSVVNEFDTALTEMRKVSDEALITLQKFQGESFDIADAVGTTALQIQQSTADFMRLGDTLEQAKKNAATANVLLNVSEFESIDDATTSLIAMEAAYKNLSGTEIIDKLNNIGNHYSIATNGIAVALQDSASALTTAGNSIDESIALITAGNAVVQDPDKVGNGLRTIALRLTGTKAAAQELEEIGEETEGMITTESKLRKTIMDATKTASNPKGFDILDNNGQYKSTYEILKGISEIWTEIAELDKKNGTTNQNLLLETMAGKNRANILASILQNPDMLQSVYIDSQSSEGSAQEELDKYLDSMDAKIQKFKNAAQELAVDFLDSNTIKFFIDFGTVLIKLLDDIAEHFNFVTVAAGLFASGLLQSMKTPIVKFGTNENGKWGATAIWQTLKQEAEKDQPEQFKEFVKQYKAENSQAGNVFTKTKDKISSVIGTAPGKGNVSDAVQQTVAEGEKKVADIIAKDVEASVGTGVTTAAPTTIKESVGKAKESVIKDIAKTAEETGNAIKEATPITLEQGRGLPVFLRNLKDESDNSDIDAILKRVEQEHAEAEAAREKARRTAFQYNDEYLSAQGTLRMDKAFGSSETANNAKIAAKEFADGVENFYYDQVAEEISNNAQANKKYHKNGRPIGDKTFNDSFGYMVLNQKAQKEGFQGQTFQSTIDRAENAKAAREAAKEAAIVAKMEAYVAPDYWNEMETFFEVTATGMVDLHEEADNMLREATASGATMTDVSSSFKSMKKKYDQGLDAFGYLDLNEQYQKQQQEAENARFSKYAEANNGFRSVQGLTNDLMPEIPKDILKDVSDIGAAMENATKKTKTFTEAFDEFVASGYNLGDTHDKWVADVERFKQAVAESNGTLEDNYEGFQKWRKGANGLGATVKNLGNTILTTFASAAISMGVSLAIQGAIQGIMYLATATKRAIEKGQEARKLINDTAKSVRDANSTIKSLGDASNQAFGNAENKAESIGDSIESLTRRYIELRKGTANNENVSLSDTEYQEFLDISNKLVDIMPELQQGTDSAGNAILNLGDNALDAASNVRMLYENYQRLQHGDIADNLKTDIKGMRNELSSSEKKSPYVSFSKDDADELLNYSYKFSPGMSDRYLFQVSWEDIITNGDAILESVRNYANESMAEAETDAAKRDIIEGLQDFERYVVETRQTISDTMNSGISYITTSDAFTGLNYNLQNDLYSQMPNLKTMLAEAWIKSGSNDSEFENIVLDSVVVPLSKVANDPAVQSQLHDLFNLDTSTLSFEDVQSKYSELLGDIFKETYTDYGDTIDNLFGLDKYRQIQTKYESIMSRKGFDIAEATGISSLADMQAAYDVLLDDNDHLINSYEDLTEAIAKAREAAFDETSYLNDYTAAQEKAHSESYNKVVDAVSNEATNMARGIRDENYAGLIGGFSKETTPDLGTMDYAAASAAISTYSSAFKAMISELANSDYVKDALAKGIDPWDININLGTEVGQKFMEAYQGVSQILQELNISQEEFNLLTAEGGANLYAMFEVFDSQQKAMEYFTEDGLGVYFFMKDVAKATKTTDGFDKSIIDVGKDGKVSFKKTGDSIKGLSQKLNISTEAAGYLLDAARDIGKVDIGVIYAQAGKNTLNGFLSDLQAVSAAMSDISSNGYLTYDSITNLVTANGAYAEGLVNTSSGMILNTEKMRELNEQAAVYATSEIQDSVETLTERYLDNTKTLQDNVKSGESVRGILKRIEDANGDLSDTTKFSADEADRFGKIWAAYTENQSLEDTIIDLQRQQSEIRANVSLMQEYKNALQTPNMNENFLTMQSGREGADKLWENGWLGTDDFITYAKLIGQNGMSDKDAILGYQESLERVGKYLTEDATGVFTFFDDAIAKGEELGVTFNDIDGYKLDIKNMEEFADAMGVTTEFAENMVLALHDAGQLDVELSMISDGIRNDLSTLGTSPLNDEKTLKNAIALTQKMGAGAESATDKLLLIQTLQDQLANGKLSDELLEYANQTLTDVRLGDDGKISATTDLITDAVDGVKSHIEKYREEANAASKTDIFKNVQSEMRALSSLSIPEINAALGLEIDEHATRDEVIDAVAKAADFTDTERLSLKLGIEIPEDTTSEVQSNLEKCYEAFNKLNELKATPEVETGEIEAAQDILIDFAKTLQGEVSQEVLAKFGIVFDESGVIDVEATKNSLAEPVQSTVTVYTAQQNITNLQNLKALVDELGGYTEGHVVIEGTEEAWDNVDELAEEIAKIPQETLVNIGFKANKGNLITADDIKSQIGSIDLSSNIKGLSSIGAGQSVKVNVTGAAEGAKDVDQLNQSLNSLTRQTTVNVNTGMAQTQIQGLNATIQALNAVVIQPSISLNVEAFDGGVSDVNGRLDTLGSTIVEPQVALQYKTFLYGVAVVSSSLSSLSGKSATPSVYLSNYYTVLSNLRSIKNELDNIKSKTITITTYRNTVTNSSKPSGGASNAFGTVQAFADGSAPKNKDITVGRSETALVNELEQESIVRGGKWSLIPGGAHFMKLRPSDIIFNGQQTRELIEKGKVLSGGGHGKLALANGTVNAYYNSSASSGGGGYGSVVNKSKSNTGYSSSNSSSSSSSSSASNAAKSTQQAAEDTAETFDWIEVKIDRIEREIEHFDTILSSTYRSWSARNSALTNEIKKTTEEIQVQYKAASNAYKRYIQEANKVSLSEKYRKLVRDGAIDISKIKDETLAKNIQEYQEWCL